MNEHKLEQEITQLIANYDIVSVVAQFHQMSYENTGKMFTGPLIVVMYSKTKQNTVETLMGEKMDICLEGWVPDHDGNKTQYDFLLTLNTPLLNIVSINNILSPIKEHVHILPLDIAANDEGMMNVTIHMTALLELKNLPTPVLN
jgi:hypothetical protein